jgi:hypothetical protein
MEMLRFWIKKYFSVLKILEMLKSSVLRAIKQMHCLLMPWGIQVEHQHQASIRLLTIERTGKVVER